MAVASKRLIDYIKMLPSHEASERGGAHERITANPLMLSMVISTCALILRSPRSHHMGLWGPT